MFEVCPCPEVEPSHHLYPSVGRVTNLYLLMVLRRVIFGHHVEICIRNLPNVAFAGRISLFVHGGALINP